MSIYDSLNYTPNEINAMNAYNALANLQAQTRANDMNAGLNIAHNLGPKSGLGFLLGNIGSTWAGFNLGNYLRDQHEKKLSTARYANNLQQYGQNLNGNIFGNSLPVSTNPAPTTENLGNYGRSLYDNAINSPYKMRMNNPFSLQNAIRGIYRQQQNSTGNFFPNPNWGN